MPFKESTRQWWIRVADNKCQYEFYTEEDGWQECQNLVDHVHHIIPEGEILIRGGDPERNTGLPLCKRHHVRGSSDEEHNPDFCFHPDIGDAYGRYGEWKSQQTHLRDIGERKSIDYSTSPFAEVNEEHRKMSERGERYVAGTPEVDQYYEDKMRIKATRYVIENQDDKKPDTAPHPKTDKSRKKGW